MSAGKSHATTSSCHCPDGSLLRIFSQILAEALGGKVGVNPSGRFTLTYETVTPTDQLQQLPELQAAVQEALAKAAADGCAHAAAAEDRAQAATGSHTAPIGTAAGHPMHAAIDSSPEPADAASKSKALDLSSADNAVGGGRSEVAGMSGSGLIQDLDQRLQQLDLKDVTRGEGALQGGSSKAPCSTAAAAGTGAEGCRDSFSLMESHGDQVKWEQS